MAKAKDSVVVSREVTEIVCGVCQNPEAAKVGKHGNPLLPKGWKHLGEQDVCKACLKDRYMQRTITIPVSGPDGVTWPELRDALRRSWQESTALANFCLHKLLCADTPRHPLMGKMPPNPNIDLYALVKQKVEEGGLSEDEKYPFREFWQGAQQSAGCVMRGVQQKYNKMRHRTIWMGEARNALHRYPYPYPVHNQSWKAYYSLDNRRLMMVDVPLLGGRFTLKLRGGPEFARQASAFRHIVDGTAIKGELALYRVRGESTRHRTGMKEIGHTSPPSRDGLGNSHRKGSDNVDWTVMCKMVAYLPKPKQIGTRDHVMLLRTDPNALWVAEIKGKPGEPWKLNNDNLVRWYAEHRVYCQRMSEDLKADKRWSSQQRRQMEASLDRRCGKHHRRVDSAIKMDASALINYAARRNVRLIIYDDSIQGYVSDFAWAELRSRVKIKAQEQSILIATADGVVESDDEEDEILEAVGV